MSDTIPWKDDLEAAIVREAREKARAEHAENMNSLLWSRVHKLSDMIDEYRRLLRDAGIPH